MDNTNYNSINGDKCPKCGAVKVFSALRCPACGAEYAMSLVNRNVNGTNVGLQNTSVARFDPNASFSAYKKSLEVRDGTSENDTPQIDNNTNTQKENSILSNVFELDKPIELDDPIAKKLKEMSVQQTTSTRNGVGQVAQIPKTPLQSHPNMAPGMPEVWYPGMSNQVNANQNIYAQDPCFQSAQGKISRENAGA